MSSQPPPAEQVRAVTLAWVAAATGVLSGGIGLTYLAGNGLPSVKLPFANAEQLFYVVDPLVWSLVLLASILLAAGLTRAPRLLMPALRVCGVAAVAVVAYPVFALFAWRELFPHNPLVFVASELARALALPFVWVALVVVLWWKFARPLREWAAARAQG